MGSGLFYLLTRIPGERHELSTCRSFNLNWVGASFCISECCCGRNSIPILVLQYCQISTRISGFGNRNTARLVSQEFCWDEKREGPVKNLHQLSVYEKTYRARGEPTMAD